MKADRLPVGVNALFLHHPHSGTGRYLAHLIREMPEEVAMDPIAARALPPRAPTRDGVVPLGTPLDRFPAFAKVWFEQVAAPRAARARGAAVFHVPHFAPPLRAPLPTVVTVHDLVPVLRPEYRRTLAQRLYTGLVCRGLRAAARIVTDSEASARDLERALRVDRRRVRVVPLGVDERFRPPRVGEAERAAAARARLGVEGPYLHYLGGLDRRKNVDRLVGAFARLKRARRLPHRLVIVGVASGGPLFYDPRPDVERLGLADSIRLLDRVSDADAIALHWGSDAFVFPSSYEGFGLPPLEALACGAPVVCSEASSLPEVVGSAAVLVDAADEAALAAAIGRVLGDRELRRDLAERGPRRAARFTWAETARMTADIYREASKAVRA
jgi:glycosyltransferase involved in cell wall biosynthesis